MNINQCCRTCLTNNLLNPIFDDFNHEEKYMSIFNLITGTTVCIYFTVYVLHVYIYTHI